MFDWLSFLERQQIEHTTRGKNVSAGNVAVKCPVCGVNDPSEHMVISLLGKGWSCWRNHQHKGKSDARLVQLLIRCSYEQALHITRGETFLPDDWYAHVMRNMRPEENQPDPLPPLNMPEEFREIGWQYSTRPYFAYLQMRGYTNGDIMKLTRRFGLRYGKRGAFRGRIIFPVYFEGRLVTWTGRTISQQEDVVRYKTLTTDPDKAKQEDTPVALGPITDYLLWWDTLIDCDANTIVLCEGPFDSLNINNYGWTRGIVSTCFTTAQPSEQQIDLLHELLPKYERKYLLLDDNTWSTAMRVSSQLMTLGLERLELPPRIKDPGLLHQDHMAGMFSTV